MPIIHKSTLVPYSQEQMFDLVNAIEAYPEFVPYCHSSRIIGHRHDELRATLCFERGGFRKSFTTLNRMHPHKMIEVRLIEGPFKQLEGFWQFEPKESRCHVSLDLEFEFASQWLSLMFGPIFNQVASTLVDAFSKRARSVYGER